MGVAIKKVVQGVGPTIKFNKKSIPGAADGTVDPTKTTTSKLSSPDKKPVVRAPRKRKAEQPPPPPDTRSILMARLGLQIDDAAIVLDEMKLDDPQRWRLNLIREYVKRLGLFNEPKIANETNEEALGWNINSYRMDGDKPFPGEMDPSLVYTKLAYDFFKYCLTQHLKYGGHHVQEVFSRFAKANTLKAGEKATLNKLKPAELLNLAVHLNTVEESYIGGIVRIGKAFNITSRSGMKRFLEHAPIEKTEINSALKRLGILEKDANEDITQEKIGLEEVADVNANGEEGFTVEPEEIFHDNGEVKETV